MEKFKKIKVRYRRRFMIAIGLSVLLLFVLTRNAFIPCLAFTDSTGDVGSTIGGVLGTLVAIVAAYLTFIAFLEQYRSNELLSEEQEKSKKDLKIERFESKFYQMLDIYSKDVEAIRCGELKGKEAFPELLGELKTIYQYLEHENSVFRNKVQYPDAARYKEEKAIYANAADIIDGSKKTKYNTKLAYDLFFYGQPHIDKFETLNKDERQLDMYYYRSLATLKWTVDKSLSYRNETVKLPSGSKEYAAPNPLLKGHNEALGHYYRHLYNLVKYVDEFDDAVISDDDTYEYVKLLRSQMSDSEQLLLYYNAFSDMGRKWRYEHIANDCADEKLKKRKEMCYLSRFRLIKNIPYSSPTFGYTPHDAFHDDIDTWRTEFGKRYFEHDLLYSISDASNGAATDQSNN